MDPSFTEWCVDLIANAWFFFKGGLGFKLDSVGKKLQ